MSQLQEENDELNANNRALKDGVTSLETINGELETTVLREKEQLAELREITELVGEQGDAMLGKLTDIYQNYKGENNRQQQQNDRQEQLQTQDIRFHVRKTELPSFIVFGSGCAYGRCSISWCLMQPY